MIRPVFVGFIASLIAGCATPVAKQYYAACIQSGATAAECEMRAIEVNQRALATFSQSMSAASASFKQATSPAAEAVHCVSTSVFDGVRTTTTCQ